MLPDWIKKDGETYIIDADIAYPELLTELKNSAGSIADDAEAWIAELKTLDLNSLNQYWIEVVYQIAKLELRRLLLLAGENAWPNMIKITGDKAKWRLKNYPSGRGVEAATKGREARSHYKRLRNFIPN